MEDAVAAVSHAHFTLVFRCRHRRRNRSDQLKFKFYARLSPSMSEVDVRARAEENSQ